MYTIKHSIIPCGDVEIDPETSARFAAELERSFFETLLGGPQKPQPTTALRHRNGHFETVEIDAAGNIIEPPKPCPRCGPVLACPEHARLCCI